MSDLPQRCKTEDILKVMPYQSREIRVGDVVVFCPAGEEHQVILAEDNSI